jgi:multiple sugar transport system substrate-binding protein
MVKFNKPWSPNSMPKKRTTSLKITSILISLWLALSACQGYIPGSGTPTTSPIPRKATQSKATYTSSARPTRTPTALPQSSTLDELKSTQIHYWQPWSGELAGLMSQLVDEFNRTNIWGIGVVMSSPGSSKALGEQVSAIPSDGLLPEVVAAPIDQLIAWQEKSSIVIDLNNYVSDSTVGLTAEERADFPKVFWDQDQAHGQQLGIPAQRSASVIFYNQSWAEALGFQEPPGNLDDFRTQTCAAAQANMKDRKVENDGTGGWIVNNDSRAILSWLTAFGAQIDQGIDSQAYDFNTDPVKLSFNYLRQLFDKNCAWTGKNQTPFDYFAQRQALFYSGDLQDILPQARAMDQLKNTDRWTVLPYPTDSKKPVVIVSGPSYAILRSTAKEQLAAWLFIKWLILPRRLASMVEASGTIPTRISAYEALSAFQKQYPAWTGTQLWLPLARPAPRQPSWQIVGSLMEDAAWQAFQPNITPAQIPQIIQQLNQMIPEVLQKNP